jgi:hypothetical protein
MIKQTDEQQFNSRHIEQQQVTVNLDWNANNWSRVEPIDRVNRPIHDVCLPALFGSAPKQYETAVKKHVNF